MQNRDRIFNLYQGNRSAVELSIEFSVLAAETGFKERALGGAFYNSLNEQMKDEPPTCDEPESLDEPMNIAVITGLLLGYYFGN